ncbi:MAG: GNAT family N-acetyltransferase [Pseudomonadota bacterium]
MLITRRATEQAEIDCAIAIDAMVAGSEVRSEYISSVAARGGLSVAAQQNEIRAFCCLDHQYFFEKPFISLLIVDPRARRCGLGSSLLSFNSKGGREVWTSTNRSNTAMRALLAKSGWRYCGELDGLDTGDPEQFFKAP